MTTGVHIRQWRGIGSISTGRRSRPSAALRKLRWGAPYLLIWLPTAVYAIVTLARTECSGVCALYNALLTFTVITVASSLSAAVAMIQLITLFLRRPSRDRMHAEAPELVALLDG